MLKRQSAFFVLISIIIFLLLASSGCKLSDGEVPSKVTPTETSSDVSSIDTNESDSNDESQNINTTDSSAEEENQPSLTSPDEVALYISQNGKLPPNYITTKEAALLGWLPSKNNLWDVAPGKSIGGDIYENYDYALPHSDSRTWYECDVNYEGGERNTERLMYSNDGLFYYTPDNGSTFEEIVID